MDIHQIQQEPHIGHEFGVGKPSADMTIHTPTGKKVFKSANHRKTSLKSALKALRNGNGDLGQLITHWKEASHRSRGIGNKSRFTLPFEYRGTSLTKLDKMVDAFNHKEWQNDTDLLNDLTVLRDEANRHLKTSGKRTLATQTLINKCQNAMATLLSKAPISRDQILNDLQNHNGAISKQLTNQTLTIEDSDKINSQEISKEISKQIMDKRLSIGEGFKLMKTFCTPEVYLQDAAGHIIVATNGDLSKIPPLLDRVPDDMNCQILNEITLGFTRQFFFETMNDALSNLNQLLTNSPSASLMLTNALTLHIKNGTLDATIASTPSFFGIDSETVPQSRIEAFKANPDEIHEFTMRMLEHADEFNAAFEALANDDPTIAITIVKAHVQQAIKGSSVSTITDRINFTQHLEVSQFNAIALLNDEKASIKEQLKSETLSQADQDQLNQQKTAVSNKINLLERGSFQDAIGEMSNEIIAEIKQLNSKNYAERAALMPGIIAQTNVDPTIQQVLVSASLAMLDRSDHLSDIESDIHTTNQHLFKSQQSTNEQLALNLNQSLSALNLTSADGITMVGNHNIPNYHAFNVLKSLIDIDATIADKATTLTVLETTCFPADDDEPFSHIKIAAFIEQYLPTNASTRQVLELLSTKYMAATNHHMVFDHMDKLPNYPTENSRKRVITLKIDPQNPTQISLQTQSTYESMNEESTELSASLAAEQTITLPFNGPPSTSFNLGQCFIRADLSESLRSSIENWNGDVVLMQSKNESPLKNTLQTHQPELTKTLEALQHNLSKEANRTNTQQNIDYLQTLLESVVKMPKKDRFQCLSQMEQLATNINANLTKLNANGQFKGINMRHLFTSQSIWNSHNYSAYKTQIESILFDIQELRFSGTKLEKSETQQYTIIEGAQGNKYELLTHMSEAEAHNWALLIF